MADANGRMSGDRGYDPSTEMGSESNLDANGYAPGDRQYNPDAARQSAGKVGKPLSAEEQWLLDNPPQPMAPVDFTNAPSWWGKQPGGRNYTDPNNGGKVGNDASQLPADAPFLGGMAMGKTGSGQQGQSPVEAARPDYSNIAQAPSTGSRMIDYIGDTGGQTGITSVSPMGAALRASAGAGGESNG